MTTQIQRVGAMLLGLFALLVINLNVLQLVRGPSLVENPANDRLIIREYQTQRGSIVAGDSEIVRSVETAGERKYQRAYVDAPLYAHLVGYDSAIFGRTQLESALDEQLVGAPSDQLAENLTGLFGGRELVGDTVRLTIEPDVQAAAARALGSRIGAVAVVDAGTGEILAQYSNPTYDPAPLASPENNVVLAAWDELRSNPDRPLLDRATRETYPPGSTFKLVVAAAALEGGLAPTSALENLAEYVPPQTTRGISNFSPGRCGDGAPTLSLADALRVSCNTAFAALGVELGVDAVASTAERLGYNTEVPALLRTADSVFPRDLDDPALAQSALGQRDVRTTVVHQALIVAAIADQGHLRRPVLVDEIVDNTGRLVRGGTVGLWRAGGTDGQAVSARTADQLRAMMIDVVERGTGQGAAIQGVVVGGKTGTAQVPDQSPTVWFVGFADDPERDRTIAIAVVIPDAGEDGTGGRLAAPIARAVLETALGRR